MSVSPGVGGRVGARTPGHGSGGDRTRQGVYEAVGGSSLRQACSPSAGRWEGTRLQGLGRSCRPGSFPHMEVIYNH